MVGLDLALRVRKSCIGYDRKDVICLFLEVFEVVQSCCHSSEDLHALLLSDLAM
jgi:hypothetical protein